VRSESTNKCGQNSRNTIIPGGIVAGLYVAVVFGVPVDAPEGGY
jgi:hypothetical protein